ncbi:MAG: sigma-70 family RNA polymerase sigma factor [Oscillospiraceae bacterium]|jgi:RNA polymerase sigma-70 factor (ECF subfamily)|nr:sigma-70 family RNA polymerase sigma factor [Oscillospiraceae bacterium]
MEDNVLLELFENRNEDVIEAVSCKYGKYCNSVAFNILRSSEDSEECVNDTWFKAWNIIPPNKPMVLRAFLGKITRNLSLTMLAKRNRHKRGKGQVEIAIDELSECIADDTDIERDFDSRATVEFIERFLDNLSEENRNIFIRRYWHLRSIEEIADDYSLSESNVKQILFRLRKKLKSVLVGNEVML